jgi:predicted extracellular nuclease
VLVIGDLNAYGAEDPIVTLEQGGFIDLVERDMPAEERYSYVFSPGQSGYLDHALTSSNLAANVTGTTIWHINADEPVFLDYTTPPFKPDSAQALYEPSPFRSSDHDPVIVGLDFSN